MKRCPLVLALSLTTAVACQTGDRCLYIGVNASISGVYYMPDEDVAYISAHEAKSYCTGTDEKRYTFYDLTVRVQDANVDVHSWDTNEYYPGQPPTNSPVEAIPLYRSLFRAGDCVDCQLSFDLQSSAATTTTMVLRSTGPIDLGLELSLWRENQLLLAHTLL